MEVERLASALLVLILLLASPSALGKQGIYETRGKAVIMRYGAITLGVEKKDIDIPTHIDVKDPQYRGLVPDVDSGWTQCRVPLKGDFTFQGPIERSLVFDCRLVR